MGHDAGLIDGRDERSGAAVHDRDFGAIDLDDGVIDAHAAQRGQNMLGRGNQRPFTVTENRGEFGGDHGTGGSLNLPLASIEPGPDENIPRIDRCGSQGQTDRCTRMNADACHSG